MKKAIRSAGQVLCGPSRALGAINPGRMSGTARHALNLCCLALLGLTVAAVPVHAQVDRGTITGTISDSTGAVVPGVQVVATNPATGQIYRAVTNSAGIYNLLNLPIATYDITYSKADYSTFIRRGVAIQVQQTAQINAQLRVGAQKQTVTVTAAPMLKLNTEVGTNMTSQEVSTLPLTAYQGRDITALHLQLRQRLRAPITKARWAVRRRIRRKCSSTEPRQMLREWVTLVSQSPRWMQLVSSRSTHRASVQLLVALVAAPSCSN